MEVLAAQALLRPLTRGRSLPRGLAVRALR